MSRMTRVTLRNAALAIAAALLITPAYADDDDLAELLHGGDDDKISAKARGTYGIAGTTATLELNAKKKEDKPAKGSFRQTLVFQGLLIDFVNEVTCITVDSANGRAWIGGIVTENNSDHSAFTTQIHQPGKDVWFRVLDTGRHSAEPDRTTFLGFEGAAGIITSEEYCQAQIWPGPPDDEPNARTNALTEGKVKVEPNDNDDDSDDDSDDD